MMLAFRPSLTLLLCVALGTPAAAQEPRATTELALLRGEYERRMDRLDARFQRRNIRANPAQRTFFEWADRISSVEDALVLYESGLRTLHTLIRIEEELITRPSTVAGGGHSVLHIARALNRELGKLWATIEDATLGGDLTLGTALPLATIGTGFIGLGAGASLGSSVSAAEAIPGVVPVASILASIAAHGLILPDGSPARGHDLEAQARNLEQSLGQSIETPEPTAATPPPTESNDSLERRRRTLAHRTRLMISRLREAQEFNDRNVQTRTDAEAEAAQDSPARSSETNVRTLDELKEIVTKLYRSSLRSETLESESAPLARLILEIEHHKKGRSLEDLERAWTRYSTLRSESRRLLHHNRNDTTFETLRRIRNLAIRAGMGRYVAAQDSLTGLLLDEGGNCVARAALVLSLLHDLRMVVPPGHQLAIETFMDHVQPVFWSRGSERALDYVTGQWTAVRGALFDPRTLLSALLEGTWGEETLTAPHQETLHVYSSPELRSQMPYALGRSTLFHYPAPPVRAIPEGQNPAQATTLEIQEFTDQVNSPVIIAPMSLSRLTDNARAIDLSAPLNRALEHHLILVQRLKKTNDQRSVVQIKTLVGRIHDDIDQSLRSMRSLSRDISRSIEVLHRELARPEFLLNLSPRLTDLERRPIVQDLLRNPWILQESVEQICRAFLLEFEPSFFEAPNLVTRIVEERHMGRCIARAPGQLEIARTIEPFAEAFNADHLALLNYLSALPTDRFLSVSQFLLMSHSRSISPRYSADIARALSNPRILGIRRERARRNVREVPPSNDLIWFDIAPEASAPEAPRSNESRPLIETSANRYALLRVLWEGNRAHDHYAHFSSHLSRLVSRTQVRWGQNNEPLVSFVNFFNLLKQNGRFFLFRRLEALQVPWTTEDEPRVEMSVDDRYHAALSHHLPSCTLGHVEANTLPLIRSVLEHTLRNPDSLFYESDSVELYFKRHFENDPSTCFRSRERLEFYLRQLDLVASRVRR